MTMDLPEQVSPAALQRARVALEEAAVGPSDSVLAAAPLLQLWQPVLIKRDVCLSGLVTGHPLLPSDYITTSPLIALDPKLIWARTMSRFYRLDEYLPLMLKEALAKDSEQGVIVMDAYGWPALDLKQAQTYLAALAAYIRANSTMN